KSVGTVVKLDVSQDYATFLLQRYDDFREEVDVPVEAMSLAIKRSFPAITASAATTFFGFLALTFMNFEIGADLGINLVKGTVLSCISVMIFLPALTLLLYPLIEKTSNTQWLPTKYNVCKYISKLALPPLILITCRIFLT